jgi:flagellar hook-associated protein 2
LSTSSIPGTNVPPVSFPGIASGINYDAIIQKLTQLTLAPTTLLNQQLATLNAANTELIKINNLFASVQTALGDLSDPSLFDTYDATSSNISVATAQGIPSATAVSGTYTINCVVVATATSITSNTAAGHNITDDITYEGSSVSSASVPLADSYAAITPTNGNNNQGSITVDGQTITYNVNSDSLNTVLSKIQTAVDANYDSNFTIGLNASGVVVVNGSKPITLGSATDQGNLLQVLKLDQAQINNSGSGPYTVTGTSGVGGLNQAGASFNNLTDEGFVDPVTTGTFTINGVTINVSASGDNLASVLARINASAAGVNASYDAATNEITLTSTTTGPQSIVLSDGTSNFLQAVGLTTGSGATTSLGTQSYVQVVNPNGSTSNIYGSSNTVTSAIPGIQLTLTSSSSVPFTVSVNSDTSGLINAINTFTSSYNAAINEINKATAPPTVVSSSEPGAAPSGEAVGGGILFGNSDVSNLSNDLLDMVSGFFGSGTGYNSLASIGLSVSDTFNVITDSNNGTQDNGGTNSGSSSNGVQSTQYQGTDGTLQSLNTSTFLAALAADPSQVEAIFQGSNSLTNNLGTYLTGVTGFPTLLNNGPVGTVPATSIMQGFEDTNTNNITNIQQQIQQIDNNANMQANTLRSEFVNTETQIAQFQALQSQLSGFFKTGS